MSRGSSWRAVLFAVARESRTARGRLAFFTACLAIGVAAVVGVSALVAAVESGLRGSSRQLLAADLSVSARRELPAELDAFFAGVPHRRADVIELAAMASAGVADDRAGQSRLVEVKAVEGGYPFYGELVLEPAGLAVADLGAEGAFAAPELLAGLGIAVGDELRLGGVAFRVLAEVRDEPDRLDFALTLGPRVFLSRAGLARTDLVQAQSRVRHEALFALPGDPTRDDLERVDDDLREALGDPEFLRVRSHSDAQRGVRRSLGRVEEYLGLVALLSLFLGGIGVSQIVRAWLAGRAASVAVMRCLGFRAREIAALFLGSVGLGLFVALVFSLPPLTSVWRVPPAAVLRAEAVPLAAPRAVRFGAPLALLAGVLVSARVQGGEWDVAGVFTGGLAVLAALLWAGARGLARLSALLPRERVGPTLHHGLAALARPGAGTTGAIVALGIGVMVVLAMLLVERRLDDALRHALPQDAPSVFLVDVQPDQWPAVEALLERHGARSIDSTPVVMARLRAIDDRTVEELSRRRGSWVLTREQRLTWRRELSTGNELVAGELWSDPERDEVSLEEEFADDLGAGLGTRLRFDAQGVPIELVVTSLRAVEWQSFAINFFLVVEPGVLEGAPHVRLAAARLDPRDEIGLQNDLALEHPTVTLLRVRPILEKIAAVLARLGAGVRALGAFTIATGLVILAGAVGSSALRRAREAALLKTLGVTRAGVTRLFAVEYALGGLVAGAVGAVGALALAWGFLEHLAELDAELPLAAIPLAALATALLAALSGLAASLHALRARPLETLREAG